MKRIVALSLAISLLLSLAACGASTSGSEFSVKEDGTSVLQGTGMNTSFPKQLPYALPYNDLEVSLSEVDLYEMKVDYSYCLFAVVTLDVSGLNDEQLHWLRKSDLRIEAYLTSEQNQYDFSPMTYLGNLLNIATDQLIFVFITSFMKENRHSFAESELVTAVDIKQEKTYQTKSSEGKTLEFPFEERLQYKLIAPEHIEDPSKIPQPLNDYIGKWMGDLAHKYK